MLKIIAEKIKDSPQTVLNSLNVIKLSQPYPNAGILSKRRYDKEYP